MNLHTKGWLPKLFQPPIGIQLDKAHLAVLIALYSIPVWYNSVRKFTPVSTEAKRDPFSFYCSTASIFWDIKAHISFLYCFAISPWQGLQPAFIIPYFRVVPGYMTEAILALGVADELSLVGLADISAPFSEAVSGDFELLFSLVSATMVELATWVRSPVASYSWIFERTNATRLKGGKT